MSFSRREFVAAAALSTAVSKQGHLKAAQSKAVALEVGRYRPGRIENEYSALSASEREALAVPITLSGIDPEGATAVIGTSAKQLKPGDSLEGWQLLAIVRMNGTATAVFEKCARHRGVLIYITASQGTILRVEKGIGQLANVRPRQINTPHGIAFKRQVPFPMGRDIPGRYILDSADDPCFENVAALGPEYIGYTLVGNEQGGPEYSLFLDALGKSRQISAQEKDKGLWAPDLVEARFDPLKLMPGEDPSLFSYAHGFSKRTLLHGYLPVANTAVWNPETKAGYEVLVVLPPGEQAQPVARVRFSLPSLSQSADKSKPRIVDRYWNTTASQFYSALAGVANRWQHFYTDRMDVSIPDPWLLDAARAGLTLSRCSYRGLEPTYQVGEGAYTKIPERSHALFPVAHYEFVWAHQLWNLTEESDPYFDHYLDRYVLPNGDFLYNTQDQVEGPLNIGIFIWNAARAYDFTRDFATLEKRLPVLRRMLSYVLERYEYSKRTYPANDRRHGLIWGSPEADLGDPRNDYPNSHPYYYQNAVWTWRGLYEYSRILTLAGNTHSSQDLITESKRYAALASEMRELITKSMQTTQAAASAEMRNDRITPFSPDDIKHRAKDLNSYENHRFMMDWFTADWGDAALDAGHLRHREVSGAQIMGLHTDGAVSRTSNFMEHGTLTVLIRQDDYRPFLLTLYSLCCYAADSGNRYAPEDAYIPGGKPGEGIPYFWSAVVNSVLQPTLGLRWLLCYEESNRDVCHLQKAAPKHWFGSGEQIDVQRCPTRFGIISWSTQSSQNGWLVSVNLPEKFTGDLAVHIHPPDRRALRSASVGSVQRDHIFLTRAQLGGKRRLDIQIN